MMSSRALLLWDRRAVLFTGSRHYSVSMLLRVALPLNACGVMAA